MRVLMTIFFCFFLALTSTAQQNNTWNLYRAVDGVEIYYQQVNCSAENIPSQVAYIIKVVNTTNVACRVSWDMKVWYNDVEQADHIADGENHMTVSVEPNKSVQGECGTPHGPLYIFKDFITYVSDTKLTRFELENIQVAKI